MYVGCLPLVRRRDNGARATRFSRLIAAWQTKGARAALKPDKRQAPREPIRNFPCPPERVFSKGLVQTPPNDPLHEGFYAFSKAHPSRPITRVPPGQDRGCLRPEIALSVAAELESLAPVRFADTEVLVAGLLRPLNRGYTLMYIPPWTIRDYVLPLVSFDAMAQAKYG